MENFHQWFKKQNHKPYLIIGKGPSYELVEKFPLDKFKTVSLNHVVKELKVDIAHVIDLDVIDECGEAFYENCDVLVMPWCPHVDNQPSDDVTLETLRCENKILNKLSNEDRLLWYNHSIAKRTRLGGPIVPVVHFSGDAAFSLLSSCGAKQVFSIGVDGGSLYSKKFSDLTPLTNKRNNFNDQFDAIRASEIRYGSKFIKLSDVANFVMPTEETVVTPPEIAMIPTIIPEAIMIPEVAEEKIVPPHVVVIMGSEKDKDWCVKILQHPAMRDKECSTYVASAHKEPRKVLDIIESHDKAIFLTIAGRSNALSGFVAANSKSVVVACPPFNDKLDMLVNIHSTLQMPSLVPVLTILDPENCAIAIDRLCKLCEN